MNGFRRWSVAGVTAVAVAASAVTACTTDELLRAAGQTLYGAGHYVCTQSSNCDTAAPGGTSSRR